ncbi:hypothetical protein [Maribellus maritimus]|uniref:hypothetical protein n=1 Tax=Maribellus maritimus TaxID=2870838 RepID=UPI001EE9FD2D|nr:hypothetical protein [Maribellus maritimus]MCG6187305.1 hypothetical protein [Maribellus maritimus]
MNRSKHKNKFGKWLIFSIGLLFTIYSLFLLTLVLFGEDKQATLTSFRQEYGERDETIRNQYTYEFAYEFVVNGETYSGTGQKVGSPVFLKTGPGTTISIKYLKCCPYFNSPVENKKTRINILVSLSIALLLLWFFRKM